MTDEELEAIYNDAISEGGTVFDGLRAVMMEEREACAKVCEKVAKVDYDDNFGAPYECAAQIRARSNVLVHRSAACGASGGTKS